MLLRQCEPQALSKTHSEVTGRSFVDCMLYVRRAPGEVSMFFTLAISIHCRYRISSKKKSSCMVKPTVT